MDRMDQLIINLGLYLGVSENPALLELLLTMAESDIKEYCRIDPLPEKYDTVVVKLAATYYKRRDGITQQSQGSRSVTFKDGIPDSIKQALPLPRIKVM